MKRSFRGALVYGLIFVMILIFVIARRGGAAETTKKVNYSEFAKYLEDGKIAEINITGTKLTGQLKGGDKDNPQYVYTYAPYITEINYLEETYIYPQMAEAILVEVFLLRGFYLGGTLTHHANQNVVLLSMLHQVHATFAPN